MNKEQACAYLNAMTACANAEIAGMQALNTYRDRRGETIAYDDAAFQAIPEKWGIYHNAVLTLFQECEP